MSSRIPRLRDEGSPKNHVGHTNGPKRDPTPTVRSLSVFALRDDTVGARLLLHQFQHGAGHADDPDANRRLGHGREFARMHTRQWRARPFAVRDLSWIDRAMLLGPHLPQPLPQFRTPHRNSSPPRPMPVFRFFLHFQISRILQSLGYFPSIA